MIAVVAMLAAACASSGATTTGAQRNVLTAEELAVAGDATLQDAISRLRPQFLRSPIGGGTTGVQARAVTVYLDGIQMVEGLEHLRQIAAKNVQEVRFLEPHQANARFGGNNTGGALVITTKK